MDGRQRLEAFLTILGIGIPVLALVCSIFFWGYLDGKKAGIRIVEQEIQNSIREGLPITFENGGVYLLKVVKSKRVSYRVMAQLEEERRLEKTK